MKEDAQFSKFRFRFAYTLSVIYCFFFVRLYLHLVNTIPEQTKPSQSNQIFREIFKHERIKIFVILLVWIINMGMDIFFLNADEKPKDIKNCQN